MMDSLWLYDEFRKQGLPIVDVGFNNIDNGNLKLAPDVIVSTCPFCRGSLRDLRKLEESSLYDEGLIRVAICEQCGWHGGSRYEEVSDSHSTEFKLSAASSSLKELDLTDVRTPLGAIREYLRMKYEGRFQLHPRLFEEVVASVFRDYGYEATVTSYSNDGGIDVILQKGDEIIGVQVKRYQNSIKVEQIRSLAGALLHKGLTRGMFVTTSDFQAGAAETVNRYGVYGYKIELVDAQRFFSALEIVQRPKKSITGNVDVDRCLGNMRTLIHFRAYKSDIDLYGPLDELPPSIDYSVFEARNSVA